MRRRNSPANKNKKDNDWIHYIRHFDRRCQDKGPYTSDLCKPCHEGTRNSVRILVYILYKDHRGILGSKYKYHCHKVHSDHKGSGSIDLHLEVL